MDEIRLFTFATQIFHSGAISRGEAKFHSPQANFVEKREQVKDLLSFFWRRHPDLNWGIKVLQTSALPLGYGAIYRDPPGSHFDQRRIRYPDSCSSRRTFEPGNLFFLWSGLRGSNPPPRPWQGRALPNELNPQSVFTRKYAMPIFNGDCRLLGASGRN